MNISNWLHKPYPLIVDIKLQLLISLSFGIFIYAFLLIFQPFGIENIIANKFTYLIGFGLVTTLVMFFIYTIAPKIAPKAFDMEKWNIGKEILYIGFTISLITIFNFEYNTTFGAGLAHQHSLFFYFPMTLAVGFFPVIILVFFTEIYLNNKHEKTASILNSEIQKERSVKGRVQNEEISIISDLKNERLELKEKDLLFIRSEENYCRITYMDKEVVRSQLLRITLKSIEAQLIKFPDIIRCHRSGIVNKKRISRISGNARAYSLHFDNYKETLSVSRNFPKERLL